MSAQPPAVQAAIVAGTSPCVQFSAAELLALALLESHITCAQLMRNVPSRYLLWLTASVLPGRQKVHLLHGRMCNLELLTSLLGGSLISCGAAGVSVLGAALTYLSYTTVGPWICTNVPFFDKYMATAPFIQGPLFAAAGVAHFVTPESFTCFYPSKVSPL